MEVAEYTDLLIQVITEATKDGSVTRSKNPDGWLRLRIDGLTTFQRNGRTIYDNTPMTVLWNQEKGSFVVMGPLWRNYLLTGPVAKRLLKHICKEAKYQMPWMNIEVEMFANKTANVFCSAQFKLPETNRTRDRLRMFRGTLAEFSYTRGILRFAVAEYVPSGVSAETLH